MNSSSLVPRVPPDIPFWCFPMSPYGMFLVICPSCFTEQYVVILAFCTSWFLLNSCFSIISAILLIKFGFYSLSYLVLVFSIWVLDVFFLKPQHVQQYAQSTKNIQKLRNNTRSQLIVMRRSYDLLQTQLVSCHI